MWLDAALAYLHYAAIFTLFSFLTVQAMLLRAPLDQRTVRLLGRADVWAAGAAGATLVTGFARGILTEAHVAITPGRDFGRNQPERHIRIAYTQPVARIREAMERIGKYIRIHA